MRTIAPRRQNSASTPQADRLRRIALIGNFPPRRCGIATFTADVYASLVGFSDKIAIDVIAINDQDSHYKYGEEVTASIEQNNLEDYIAMAEWLNERDVDLVCVQHEFGIFGGEAGQHLLTFLAAVRAPVVTTLHTILERPNVDQRRVMDAILARSARVIAMAERGRDMLIKIYGADPRRVAVIPHGAPDRPFGSAGKYKRRLGLAGHRVLMTFGLLSPSKGLESVIRALPDIVSKRPDTLYVIVGATHPHLLRREGEAYRDGLMKLAREKGVEDHVRFVNKYLDSDALLDHLAAADVYVTPYLNEAQITSGTLAYAVAMGKPVVSTPYWHAQELLSRGVGMLVNFNDSNGFARAINKLLGSDTVRQSYRERAYRAGRETIWSRSAERYVDTFRSAIAEPVVVETPEVALQPLNMTSVLRMTDDCGMLQHARFRVPDRRHGYCIDDNARALLLVQRARAMGVQGDALDDLETIYASFLDHAWNPDTGRFRNFMSYSRQWLEDVGSDDSNGRTFWALGEVASSAANPELRTWALDLARQVAQRLSTMTSLRAQAFCVLGADAALDAAPNDPDFLTLLRGGAIFILEALRRELRPDWIWPENVLAYDNARLPQALILAGRRLDDEALVEAGLAMLRWLTSLHTAPLGHFRPVGNETFGKPYSRPAAFDQQPLEAAAAVDACWTAFDVSRDEEWSAEAERAYAWFFGANDLFVQLEPDGEGGCYDGLGRKGVNRNQGAESILSFQLSNCEMSIRTRAYERAPD